MSICLESWKEILIFCLSLFPMVHLYFYISAPGSWSRCFPVLTHRLKPRFYPAQCVTNVHSESVSLLWAKGVTYMGLNGVRTTLVSSLCSSCILCGIVAVTLSPLCFISGQIASPPRFKVQHGKPAAYSQTFPAPLPFALFFPTNLYFPFVNPLIWLQFLIVFHLTCFVFILSVCNFLCRTLYV